MGQLGNVGEVSAGFGGLGGADGGFGLKSVTFDGVGKRPYVFPTEGKNGMLGNEGLGSGGGDGKLLGCQNKAENCRHQSFDTGNPEAWSKKKVS